MVKTPPCDQYEPPRNILYHRNGKQFCRISKEGKGKEYQIPPCDQYGPNYVIYTKNNKEFCRKSKSHIQKRINKKRKTKKLFNDKQDCKNTGIRKLNKYSKFLNINLSKYNDKDWICQNINNFFNISEPNKDTIKYVSNILKIKTKKKKEKELCHIIKKKIISENNQTFNEILNLIQNNKKLTDLQLSYLIVNLIISIINPYNFPHDSPIPLSETLYKKLIKDKKKNEYIDKDDEILLENSLYIKLCHCIQKLFLKNKFLKDMFNMEIDKNIQYPICTDSIYKQRGFELPKDSIKNCSKNFDWYKLINNIQKSKTTHTRNILKKKKNKSSTKKRKKKELKGGDVLKINPEGSTLQYGHIGPIVPNKTIIRDNNEIACFNSFKKHPATQWPNRFACPDRRCDYWAGKKKKNKMIKKLKTKKKQMGGNSSITDLTNNKMILKALPSNSGKYNQLKYGEKLALGLYPDSKNWKSWMKNHDNYYWASN